MNSGDAHNPAALGVFVGLLFLFAWISAGLIVSRMSGWHKLAQRFALQGDFPSRCWRWRSATARYGSHYNNCLRVAADPAGLYMAMPWLFRIGHPPLFIPWSEISISHTKVLLWKMTRFEFGRENPISFSFREDFAEQIRAAAGSSWPKLTIT